MATNTCVSPLDRILRTASNHFKLLQSAGGSTDAKGTTFSVLFMGQIQSVILQIQSVTVERQFKS